MTVTYWLTDTATGLWAMVDPTYDVLETWGDRLAKASPPHALYITHAHFDHVAGLADMLRRYPGIPVWVHPEGKRLVEDGSVNGATWAGFPYEASTVTNLYREGDTVSLGESPLKVLDAPGHCPGSVLLLNDGKLIAGDVLFQGSVGRWDLPGADYDLLAASIREKIMALPESTIVYPGHGPATTVGNERRSNFIVQKMILGERY
jgi:glyoxylase-like metal-dependent hydrolase (beta-lactamase superfamily II)